MITGLKKITASHPGLGWTPASPATFLLRQKAKDLPIICDESFASAGFSVIKSRSGEKWHPDRGSCQSKQEERVKISCTFNPHRLPRNWIKEMRHNKKINWNKEEKILQILVAWTEARTRTLHRLLPMWKHGWRHTGEQPSSLPEAPGLMLALSHFGWGSPATSVSAHSHWRV